MRPRVGQIYSEKWHTGTVSTYSVAHWYRQYVFRGTQVPAVHTRELIRELIRDRKTSLKHNNKDLGRLQYLSPGMR